MMTRTLAAAIAAAMLAMAGCGDAPDAEAEAAADDAEPRETPIADELKRPMDKAAAVEDMAMERKAEMDRRLAEMEGETDDEEDP